MRPPRLRLTHLLDAARMVSGNRGSTPESLLVRAGDRWAEAGGHRVAQLMVLRTRARTRYAKTDSEDWAVVDAALTKVILEAGASTLSMSHAADEVVGLDILIGGQQPA